MALDGAAGRVSTMALSAPAEHPDVRARGPATMDDAHAFGGSHGDIRPNLTDRPVEAQLDSCAVRGVLRTVHPRVSDHLGAAGDLLRIVGAQVVRRDGTPLGGASDVLVSKAALLYLIDLTPPGTGELQRHIERDDAPVVLSVGPIWLRGHAHIPVGGDLETYVAGALNRFIPITGATVLGQEPATPRTILVNRDKLQLMLRDQA
jgi:hypothetical protein